MSKQAKARRLKGVEAMCKVRTLRTSPRKLNLVAQQIRGQTAEKALATLTFSPKRVAQEVKKVLQSAIANAENNHDLDVDDLVVAQAWVGRNMVMKRFHARARGRGAHVEKPFAQVTIVVEEKHEEKKAEAGKEGGAKKRRAPAKREKTKSKELA